LKQTNHCCQLFRQWAWESQLNNKTLTKARQK
jgi:hypothetical protein